MVWVMTGERVAAAAGLEPFISEVVLGGTTGSPTAGTVLPEGFEVTVPDADAGGGSGLTLVVIDASELRFGVSDFQAQLPAVASASTVMATDSAWTGSTLPGSTFRVFGDLSQVGFWTLNGARTLLLFDGHWDFNVSSQLPITQDPTLATVRGSGALVDWVTLVPDTAFSVGLDTHASAFEGAFGVDLRDRVVDYTDAHRFAVRDVINSAPVDAWGLGEPEAVGGFDQFQDDGRWYTVTPGLANVASQAVGAGVEMPEPSGLVLLGFGLGVMVCGVGRRRRADPDYGRV